MELGIGKGVFDNGGGDAVENKDLRRTDKGDRFAAGMQGALGGKSGGGGTLF